MNIPKSFRSAAAAATMASLLVASPAMASLNEAATDCRATIAKSFSSLMKTATKTIAGCHKSRDKDATLLGTDCNVMSQADAAKGKYAAAVTKQVAAINDACPASLNSTLTQASYGGGPQYYVSCPVTCPDVGANPMTTMADVADCLGCLAASIAGDVSAATMGLPGVLPLSKEDGKCHGAIGKGFSKYLLSALKTENGCQKDSDKVGVNTLAACIDYDPKDKVAGTLQKAYDGLDKSCVGANVANLDSCGADLASVKSCNTAEWGSAEDDTFSETYELPGNLCPNVIRTLIHGGCGTGNSGTSSKCQGPTNPGLICSTNADCGVALGDECVSACNFGFVSGTKLNVGWKGLGHNLDVTDGYTLAGSVDCGANDTKGACGTCTITGISTDNPQYGAFTRCVDNTSIACDPPFGTDPACGQYCTGGESDPSTPCTSNGDCVGADVCTSGACRYFLGPPLSVNAGGTPTCTLNVVNSDITGTVNPDAGESQFTVDLRSIVSLGLSQNHPCPICQGDTTPRDGVKDGHCFGGDRNGQVCDVQGFDLSFAPTLECSGGGKNDGTSCSQNSDCDSSLCSQTGTDLHDGNSLDCPLPSGANISGEGLAIQLPLGTGTSMKSAQDPCDGTNSGINCFCGACDADPTVSCETDNECILLGLGNCGQGNGLARLPNDCSDVNCTAVPGQTDRGSCQASPIADVLSYCDGLLFANGHGVVTCTDDSTCDSLVTGSEDPLDWNCPNDHCGTCSFQDYKSCFLDPISISGTPSTTDPILAGTFCLPPSSSGSVNNATGSPGPGTVQTDTSVELRY